MMFWFIVVVVIAVIIAVRIRAAINEDKTTGSSSYSSGAGRYSSPAPQTVWREPVTPDEHFVLLSIMADALCDYGMGINESGMSEVNMTVTYSFAPNEPDRVKLTLYGVNSTSIFENSRAWQYLRSHAKQDGFYVEWEFEFPSSQGGAPFYYRDERSVMEFVRQFAPTVYSCPRKGFDGSGDHSWLCFRKDSIRRKTETVDAEIVNAYSTYRKY